jgi:flagellar motility protein MotE (MotC chaperone)
MTMLSRVRILPIAIALAVAVLGLKIGDAWRHSGSALAQQPQAQPAQAPAAPAAQAPAEAPPAAPVGAAPSASPARALDDITNLTASEIEVLQQLVVRRAEIERRGAELSRREAVLKAAEERIQAKIEEMKKLQAGVEQAIRRYDEQEEQRRKSLVKIYETMKPQEAAKIFEQMDLTTLVEMVERMSERKVAPVLAAMNPVRAKQVTTELSKRRKPGETPGQPAAAAGAPAPAGG